MVPFGKRHVNQLGQKCSPGSGMVHMEPGIPQEIKQEVVDAHINMERSVDKALNREDLPDRENQGEFTSGVEGVRCSSHVSVKPWRLFEEM